MIAVLIGIIAGAVSTVQASVNNRVREINGSPYTTALLNFIAAGTVLVAIILVMEHELYLPVRAIAQHPFWIWCGGVCGATIVTLNVICLPKLGSARNVMIICFAQVMTGLVIDHFGLFYSTRVPMTVMRTAGAVLVLTGTLMVNGIRFGRPDSSATPGGSHGVMRTDDASADEADEVAGASAGDAPYVILALICGFACSAQIAFNGALREVTESAAKATLISMMGGFITALLVIALITIFKGKNGIYDDPVSGRPSYRFRLSMFLGGILAVIVVGGNAIIADTLSTGLVTILNLIGMMGAGLAIDAAGFLGIEKKPVTAVKVTGMLLMTGGTAMISLI
ncbi:MAG: DMT family transporter [Mogibacterium sp.]|nr:DMT family transporter [Mogibacterium sp.]